MTKHAALVAAGLFLMACGAQPTPPRVASTADMERQDPGTLVALLASASTPGESRKSADRALVVQEGKGYAPRVAVLEQLLYQAGQPEEMRVYALDQLAEADAARAGTALQLYLPRMEGAVLAHACDVAVKLGDERVVEALIRSMARGVMMEDGDGERLRGRPEWGAVGTLSGKTVVEALYGAIAGGRDRSVRIAALDCVQRVEPAETVRGRVMAMKREDPWLRDVQWWAGIFGTMPVGQAESKQVEFLHRPEQGALVARAAQRHQKLKGEADYVAAPRFVAVLAYASDRDVGLSRGALLEGLIGLVAAAEAGPLSRGDLLVLRLVQDRLNEGTLFGALHQQGLEDLSDTGTAHGGLLTLQNINAPTVSPVAFPSAETGDENQYVPSDSLVQRAGTGLALYHLAFKQVRNGDRAMPSVDELSRAREGRWNALKMTSVDTREIRIVFYTSGGVVVHLGLYTIK